MMTKKTALKEAGRFAAALDGPLGQRPMQRVVEDFLDFFEALRAAGASWPQIANLLFSVGVRTRSGRPLSEAVLRAVVSRQGPASRLSAGYASERAGPAAKAGDGEDTPTLLIQADIAAGVPLR